MTTTMAKISAALNLIDSKKENLRKAFEDVQAHSSSLSSFSLSWSDLDSHFSSIQSSLTHKFHLLHSQSQSQTLTHPTTEPSTSKFQAESNTQLVNSPVNSTPLVASTSVSGSARPELRSFCEKMDGKGLRTYLMDHLKERESITAEISDALRYAPNAAKMVLDVLDDAQSMSKNMKVKKSNALRNTNVMMLEGLVCVVKKEEINGELKEKAKKLVMELKGQISKAGEYMRMEAFEILHLLDIYGVVNEFDVDEVVNLVILAAKYRAATYFCRELVLVDKVPEIVQKLIDKGDKLLAVKFICEFKLTDKFPPVPLLKAHVKDLKKATHNNPSNRSHNEAREIRELKSVLKSIEDYNLESEYPRKIIEKQIERIAKMKHDKKRSAPTPQPNAPKAKRNNSNGPSSSHRQTANWIQQSPHLQTMPGLIPDPWTYPYSTTGPAGMYNPSSSSAHLYSSEAQMAAAPGYYNRSTAYSLPPPQYHPGYYPHPQ